MWFELCRIDEHGDNDKIRFLTCQSHERQMTFVQGTHGWNETNCQVFSPRCGDDAPYTFDASDNPHGGLYTTCRVPAR